MTNPEWGPPQQPPAPAQWAPPQPPGPPPTLPVQPTGYHQFWRAPAILAWRPIVVILLGAGLFLLLSVIVPLAAAGIEMATGAATHDVLGEFVEDQRMSPGLVLGNSVAIGLMVPGTLLLARLTKQRPRFLHSVLGRFRWTWFWVCIGASLVVLLANMGIELLIVGPEAYQMEVHHYTWWLLIGLLLVTPFQAAAEEYMLRGVVFRAVGSWFRQPVVALALGTVVNSAVFMLLHGAADPWLNAFYFVLGALLSWLTWRTGGLEAAIAVHTVNNMIAFTIVPFQDVSDLFDRSAGVAGPIVLWQMAAMALLVVALGVLARRRDVARVGPPLR